MAQFYLFMHVYRTGRFKVFMERPALEALILRTSTEYSHFCLRPQLSVDPEQSFAAKIIDRITS